MTEPAHTFVAAAATDGEAWVLATGLPGFVPAAEFEARSALAADVERLRTELGELEKRRNDMAAELDAARLAARHAGAEEAQAAIGAALAEIAGRTAGIEAAALAAALAAAEALIRAQVVADPDAMRRLVREAMGRRLSVVPLAVRASTTVVTSVAMALDSPSIRVVADPSLAVGDLVIEYPDGQIDLRIDRLLDHLREPVRAILLQAVGDGG
jgi:flagellar assembly protein FliH